MDDKGLVALTKLQDNLTQAITSILALSMADYSYISRATEKRIDYAVVAGWVYALDKHRSQVKDECNQLEDELKAEIGASE